MKKLAVAACITGIAGLGAALYYHYRYGERKSVDKSSSKNENKSGKQDIVAAALNASDKDLQEPGSLAVTMAQIDGISPPLQLDASIDCSSPSSLLRRRQAGRDVSDPALLNMPLLSMAVSAAILEDCVASPTIHLDPPSAPSSNGSQGSAQPSRLLLRRRSSKKLPGSDAAAAAAAAVASGLDDVPKLSMAVSYAQLLGESGSPLVKLELAAEIPPDGKSPSILLRRSSRKLSASPLTTLLAPPPGGPGPVPTGSVDEVAGAPPPPPPLSMAVSAAHLDGTSGSPTLTMEPVLGPGLPGGKSSLLHRRQSSRRMIQDPAVAATLPPPALSMAVSAAQLDESGGSPTLVLEPSLSAPSTATATATGTSPARVPNLLARRQSSRKMLSSAVAAATSPPGPVAAASMATGPRR